MRDDPTVLGALSSAALNLAEADGALSVAQENAGDIVAVELRSISEQLKSIRARVRTLAREHFELVVRRQADHI